MPVTNHCIAGFLAPLQPGLCTAMGNPVRHLPCSYFRDCIEKEKCSESTEKRRYLFFSRKLYLECWAAFPCTNPTPTPPCSNKQGVAVHDNIVVLVGYGDGMCGRCPFAPPLRTSSQGLRVTCNDLPT